MQQVNQEQKAKEVTATEAPAVEGKQDLYQKITSLIVEALERGCPPWRKPWNAEHAAGRIERPLTAC
jgi:antirestriction protein ArdC